MSSEPSIAASLCGEGPGLEPLPADGAAERRAGLVAFARESIARGSRSFAAASRLFDPATRERAWLLYAWCRHCDDLADGQVMGHGMSAVADAAARVAYMRETSLAALAGRATGDPPFDCLAIVAAEIRLPPRLAMDVVDGFALDADEWRPRHEADLYRYCYHVAGAVGCMMAIVMGVDPEEEAVLDRACDLGIAFQLANIARDLCEDDAAGRCYLPEDWLAEMDFPPGEQMRPHHRGKLALLARRLAERAGAYEASARLGAAALPYRSAWAVLAAAGIYGDIAREVARRGEQAWRVRVVTSRAAKAGWIARAGWQAVARQARGRRTDGAMARETLWSRPR